MQKTNQEYHADRAEQERLTADQGDSDIASRIHREMADRHAAEAKRDREKLHIV